MSQSYGPEEVVHQVKETLQLDQASLEHPEPEAKRLIRCLARKAKCYDRVDVVKHLRDITPAGTTGEFDMSVIYLSGTSVIKATCNDITQ